MADGGPVCEVTRLHEVVGKIEANAFYPELVVVHVLPKLVVANELSSSNHG